MSELSDRIAYLKGLRAGMDAAADTHEGKLISALIDALDAAADEIKALRSDHEELKEYVDVLDDDLSELEDEVYSDEFDDDDDDASFDDDDDSDDDDCDDCDNDDCDDGCEGDDCEDGGCHCGHHEHGFSEAMLDQPLTERMCPACGKPISISMRALLNRNDPIVCPHCGQKFRAQTPDDK